MKPQWAPFKVGFDGIFLDVLTDKLINVVGLSVGQRASFSLTLHQSVVEVLLVLGEAEALIVWTRDVMHGAQTTLT